MPNEVQFDEDRFAGGPAYSMSPGQVESSIENFFIKIGLAKDSSQAKIVMIVLTLLCFLGIFLVFYFSSKPPAGALSEEESKEMMLQNHPELSNVLK